MPMLTRRTFVSLAGAAATLPLIGGRALAAADGPLKVAFMYVGPVGDFGYSYAHDQARERMVEELGDQVETTIVESVAEGPDAERVLRELAQQGNQLIFATSFGFMNQAVKVSQQFPDVHFEHATGYQRTDNLATYNARFHEGRAVIGTIAGHMSESGIAGYVASFPIPEVVMGINAFTLAARRINPDFQTKVVWVNSWYDPAKEGDAARALLDQGADVITQHTDSPAPLQVAEERGAIAFGQASDMSSFAPKAHMTAIVDDWAPYYIERARAAIDGTWSSTDVWWGMKEGMVVMSEYNPAMPEDVRAAAQQVEQGIKDGTFDIFTGPITDQAGTERVAAGETIPDEQLLTMDWYVEGVQS